ncbi:MAG TPA: response regulator [Thermoanaerobaculaceae bacterium]|nr:response regulator [Thermoanaerobaculaceae bacterium]HPS77030.1 response regulator [Thermoanaerobaculaceae bacterium]
MASTILLADDSITIQKVVELTFGETNHRVVAVSSGRELLRRLPEEKPDIILCDVVMPDLNGYEVCQSLKADPLTLHLPVVLLTGTFEPFDRDRAIASGCDAIVTKPFEGRELVSVVEDLLRRSRSLPVAEPEPSFFPGLGAPEGMPGLEFTTTGFDQMVPQPPEEPGIPDHGIEMTGVSPRLPEARESDEVFAFGGSEAAPAGLTPHVEGADADDSWVDRVSSDAAAVGSMQGDFFTSPPSSAPPGAEAPVAPPETEPLEDAPTPVLLSPWQESADLQSRDAAAPEVVAPDVEPDLEGPAIAASSTGFAGEPPIPVPYGGQAFSGPPAATTPWQEPEAAEEPDAEMWPAPPTPHDFPATLGSLNPARESVASAWQDEAEMQGAEGTSELVETAPEPGFLHPEPGFPFGAIAAPPERPLDERGHGLSAPHLEDAVEPAVVETTEAAAEPLAPTADNGLPIGSPFVVPVAEADTPAEPAASEVGDGPPTIPAGEPAIPAEEGAEEPAIAKPVPPVDTMDAVDAGLLPAEVPEEPALAAEAEPMRSAAAFTDELIELIAGRVLARIPRPDLGEEQVLAVAQRAAQLIPPVPPPDLPPLSYELEEPDILRVAQRVVEIIPPPPAPGPVRLSEDEVEFVAQRVLALVPPPELPPVVVPPDEVQRITEHVLASMTAPPPPELPESEVARVADRVVAMLPPPPAAAAAELSEAALEQIARRVLDLAAPLIERIAWEVIPDMAEMLVRRRIEDLERDTES